jgi:hypothetical protein
MGISHSHYKNYTADYLHLKNKYTGEDFMIDRKKSRYEKISKGFLNKIKLETRYVKHIMLSQTKESYRPKLINYFLSALRRFYKDVVYIWTVEVQEERRDKYGEAVLHWHIMVSFPFDTDFERDDILRLQQYWKYGRCDITPVKFPSTKYLMKYIGKALGSNLETIYKLRRIGSSRLENWLKQSWTRVLGAYEYFKHFYEGYGFDCLSDFNWQNGRAFLWDTWDLGGFQGHIKRIIYKPTPSGWKIWAGYNGEPF